VTFERTLSGRKAPIRGGKRPRKSWSQKVFGLAGTLALPAEGEWWAASILGIVLLAFADGARGAEADQKLFQAVQQGNLTLLQAAVAEGADVNGRGTNGLPPLLVLLRAAAGPLDSEHRQCVAWLLAHGAAADPTDSDRRTPLIHAARLGDLETIRLLVEAEAYVMTRDRFHKSALFYAVEAGRRDIVLYLATNGDLVSLSVKEKKAARRAR
jgi:ankyrin repeat protein